MNICSVLICIDPSPPSLTTPSQWSLLYSLPLGRPLACLSPLVSESKAKKKWQRFFFARLANGKSFNREHAHCATHTQVLGERRRGSTGRRSTRGRRLAERGDLNAWEIDKPNGVFIRYGADVTSDWHNRRRRRLSVAPFRTLDKRPACVDTQTAL